MLRALTALILSVAGATLSVEADEYRLSRISYLTSVSIYIDAGSDQGLSPGQAIEVIRDGEVIATLYVTEVTSRRALCERPDNAPLLEVGDTVRFVPRAAPETPAIAQEPHRDSGPQENPLRALGLRGRVGVRYLAVQDRLGSEQEFSQPALDLRLDGNHVGGSSFGLNVDVRARQTYRTSTDGASDREGLTRVYRAAVSFQPLESPWRVTAGRQVSPSLAAVSIFDGVEGEYRAARWSLGAFSGTQPDPEDFGYSSRIREHGGYAQWRNASGSSRRWSMTTGLIGSYEEGEINREYSYLQGSYGGPRLFAHVIEEVDFNRGWKEQAGEESVSLTSTFVSVRYRAGKALTLNAGYDNRRNVRLYRDRITPETEFDDEYRNGTWGGATLRLGSHLDVGADLRSSDGGEAPGADAVSLYLDLRDITRLGMDFHTRSTRYESGEVDGTLHSLSVGIPFGSLWHADLLGGVRDETNLVDPQFSGQATWYGLDVEVNLGRSWYFLASVERSRGDEEASDQLYGSLTYRF